MRACFHPLHRAFGVEIGGVDLADGAEAVDLIGAALRRYRLVVIRDQRLDEADQLAVAARLGCLVGTRRAPDGGWVPQVRYETDAADGGPQPIRSVYNQQWHADLSWAERGAPVSLLHAVAAGRSCAPTAFADMIAAYDALDATTRATIAPWHAYHHVARARELRYGQAARQRSDAPTAGRPHERVAAAGRRVARALRRYARLDDEHDAWRRRVVPARTVPLPGALHPVVQTDRASGRRFVHAGDHAWTLAGSDELGGLARIDELNRRLVTDGNVHQHRWAAGDLVIFDNRSLLHRRSPEGDVAARRVLRRCAVWTQS